MCCILIVYSSGVLPVRFEKAVVPPGVPISFLDVLDCLDGVYTGKVDQATVR